MTALDQVRKTTRQRSQAQTAWERALRDARASGATLEAIATEAGVSRQRVWQILAEREAHPVASVTCEHGRIIGDCREC